MSHPLRSRQVHLDFHTSPHIADAFTQWDAEAFAETMARAHVNSVTVFAKCHHGLSYYPTEIGQAHPQLGSRDLLGEQIAALNARGIAAPIYYTVGWEERLAHLHPEWRQVMRDGHAPRAGDHPGAWWFMSYLHPEYLAHMRRELREILNRYPVEEIFFDIVFSHPNAGFEEHAQKIRHEHGIAEFSLEHQQRWNGLSKKLFAEIMTPIILESHPQARVFYNSAHTLSIDSRHGLRGINQVQTHWEIESLPSGFWGYHHFPRFARHVAGFGQEWLGMTGRFQRMWGDFGGIKPQAALEYECFRTQAHGGANSVGDQLPPRGQLDQAAYDLIGNVYAQCEAAEEFYAGSSDMFDVGLMLASHAMVDAGKSGKIEEGAVMALEEMHYNPAVFDDASDLEQFKLIILLDTTVVTKILREKLEMYYKNGGKLIISNRGGMNEHGEWALDFLPVKYLGELEMQPTYWRATKEFWPEVSASDRVFYEPGLKLEPTENSRVLVDRVLPYFERTDTHFMSHLQAPPVKNACEYPAVIAGKNFAIFADPIFGAYRQNGSGFIRAVLERVMHDLIGSPEIGHGLARSILCVPRKLTREKNGKRIVTLLHYIPQRKALDGDVLEEASSFAGEVLRIPGATRAKIFNGRELETLEPGTFILPAIRGRLMIEVD